MHESGGEVAARQAGSVHRQILPFCRAGAQDGGG